MRIGSAPDPTQQLLFMLAAAQRQPALLRRPKQRAWQQETGGILGFCDAVAARAKVGDEAMAEILPD